MRLDTNFSIGETAFTIVNGKIITGTIGYMEVLIYSNLIRVNCELSESAGIKEQERFFKSKKELVDSL
jgi:hypothetical protein